MLGNPHRPPNPPTPPPLSPAALHLLTPRVSTTFYYKIVRFGPGAVPGPVSRPLAPVRRMGRVQPGADAGEFSDAVLSGPRCGG